MKNQNKTALGDGCNLCSCVQCCAQIPESAAITVEGGEYVQHFCSQECYEKWQNNQKQIDKELNHE